MVRWCAGAGTQSRGQAVPEHTCGVEVSQGSDLKPLGLENKDYEDHADVTLSSSISESHWLDGTLQRSCSLCKQQTTVWKAAGSSVCVCVAWRGDFSFSLYCSVWMDAELFVEKVCAWLKLSFEMYIFKCLYISVQMARWCLEKVHVWWDQKDQYRLFSEGQTQELLKCSRTQREVCMMESRRPELMDVLLKLDFLDCIITRDLCC